MEDQEKATSWWVAAAVSKCISFIAELIFFFCHKKVFNKGYSVKISAVPLEIDFSHSVCYGFYRMSLYNKVTWKVFLFWNFPGAVPVPLPPSCPAPGWVSRPCPVTPGNCPQSPGPRDLLTCRVPNNLEVQMLINSNWFGRRDWWIPVTAFLSTTGVGCLF